MQSHATPNYRKKPLSLALQQQRMMLLGVCSLFSTFSVAQEQIPQTNMASAISTVNTKSSLSTDETTTKTSAQPLVNSSDASTQVIFTENTQLSEAIAEHTAQLPTNSNNQQGIDRTALQQAIQSFQQDAVYKLDPRELPIADQNMLNEINAIAQQARQDAQQNAHHTPSIEQVLNAEKPVLNSISNVDMSSENAIELQQKLAQDTLVLPDVDSSLQGKKSQIATGAENISAENTEKQRFWKRLLRREKRVEQVKVEPKIVVQVSGDGQPAQNIQAKLSNITQDSFADYQLIAPELKTSAVQAAQAVGYFQSEISLKKQDDQTLNVQLKANDPVKVESQIIEFSGAGANAPVFQVIQMVPNLEIGDTLNQGLYETTKNRIHTAANEQGYFDAYWRMHDLKVTLPENRADIQLKFDTGTRYQLQDVEFRMSDPKKPFPLRQSVLKKLVPFKAGDDFTQWRINQLSNNLINSRYFNYTTVDVIRPDAIQRPPELPDDVRQQQGAAITSAVNNNNVNVSYQNIADEQQFAGNEQQPTTAIDDDLVKTLNQEREARKKQAREIKQIPVIVELNADYLNNLEAGLGYGTDTGVRLRSQYRRAIVNDRGHSFEGNLEASKIRQSVSGRYLLPYHHPLNDYLSLLGGYEREKRGTNNLTIESAVAGIERFIKRPLGEWQHTMSLRYRFDQMKNRNNADVDLLPQAFKSVYANPTQQSLLLGYEASKTVQDDAINPTKGFRQFYRVEVGSKQALTETDMAIFTAGWRGIGKEQNYQ